MATTRTVQELINIALRRTRYLTQEQTLPQVSGQNALDVFQDLLAEWSNEGLLIPYVKTEYFSLVSGTASYTVGENGTPSLNTPRPEQILRAWVRDSSGNDYGVKVVGSREWSTIGDKTGVSGRPDTLYPEYSAPNVTFYLYPVCNDSSDDLYFQHRAVLSEPSDFDDVPLSSLYIPRNYHNAISWNLALEMVEEVGGVPSALMVQRARETKSKIIGLNAVRSAEPARLDIAVGDRRYTYSIFED